MDIKTQQLKILQRQATYEYNGSNYRELFALIPNGIRILEYPKEEGPPHTFYNNHVKFVPGPTVKDDILKSKTTKGKKHYKPCKLYHKSNEVCASYDQWHVMNDEFKPCHITQNRLYLDVLPKLIKSMNTSDPTPQVDDQEPAPPPD
jgi:hypothetical protein